MLSVIEKQGYKYTEEFGYIPNDWEVAKVSAKTNVVTGGTPSTRISEYWNGNIKWMSSGELNNKRIYNTEGRITELGLNNSSATLIPENCILIGLAGQGKTRGTAAINYVELSTNQSIAAILPSKHFNSEYLYQSIDKRYEELRELSSGGGGRGGLNKALLMNLPILLPLIPEQEKIAEVLGDVDSLIDKTQQLINKKKDLKTATMQKIMKPKENWTTKELSEIAIYRRGSFPQPYGLDKWYDDVDGMPFVQVFDIDDDFKLKTETKRKISKIAQPMSVFIPKNSIVLTIQGSIGRIAITDYDCYLDRTLLYFEKLLDKFNPYFFMTSVYNIFQKEKENAPGGIIKTITKEALSKFNIHYPNIEEQNRIATILSDMDSEIEALEKELNKYKDLKTGMMQQLLTGKIRLTDKEVKSDNKVIEITSVKPQNEANNEFKDAILISMLAYKFGSEEYPLGAFRRQKLSYIFKRHNNIPIDDYMKKAMGPYNPKMKYQGAENIALKNKYVKNVGGRGLIAADSISKAEEYYNRYYQQESLNWLINHFQKMTNNNMEVLATVDYAIVDLKNQNKDITLENIKSYIASDEDWKPKLNLDYFTDNAILKAMETSKTLLNSY